MTDDTRQHHDMGGLDANTVSPTSHEFEPWEKRIEALVRLLSLRDPPIVTIDELRRGIEELPPEVYDGVTYYEKWIAGLTEILVEKGVLERGELEARMADVAARKAAGEPMVEKSAGGA
jgi:hypothetical protein